MTSNLSPDVAQVLAEAEEKPWGSDFCDDPVPWVFTPAQLQAMLVAVNAYARLVRERDEAHTTTRALLKDRDEARAEVERLRTPSPRRPLRYAGRRAAA